MSSPKSPKSDQSAMRSSMSPKSPQDAPDPTDARQHPTNTQIPYNEDDADDQDSTYDDDGRLAGIPGVGMVLDVGTGTGIWAIDMADAYPSAEITGTDISPIQPAWVPPNCQFHIEDAQLEWTYRPESFDFVHIRALYGSISDWGELYRQAFRSLEPGGWIENMEINIHMYSDIPEVRDDPDHIFKRWAKVFWEATDMINRTLRIAMNGTQRKLMVEAGFVNVVEKTYQVPCGAWSSDPKMKKIGAYNLAFMDESLEGFALFMLREIMKWEYEEVQLFVMEMRKAVRDSKIRPYYLM
ncbi:hypothetical protein LZL87_014078 [Fusarium oxysporum]|nr:hypothetical protein LZL87_014078 [Fusarium oxysporum]